MNFARIWFFLVLFTHGLCSASTWPIVKISSYSLQYSYLCPWAPPYQRSGGGTGFVIDGNRILTNAHVVSNSVFLEVKLPNKPQKYTACVEWIGHDCDLALLRVEDASFFKGIEPLEFADSCSVRDRIVVVGFPMGGEELCFTEGVVSRTEVIPYVHGNFPLSSTQIDAPVNAGNSGGPVLCDGKVVGVIHQSAAFGQNINRMIPLSVIDHFLHDVKDQNYDGFPHLGIFCQVMENPDMRRFYGMEEEQSGVLVTDVAFCSPLQGKVEVGDIILSIDGVEVANDGTISFSDEQRISVVHLTNSKFYGHEISLCLLRKGEVIENKFILGHSPCVELIPGCEYGKRPTFFIKGGLIFQPLTDNYLKSWGDDWRFTAPINLLYYRNYGVQKKNRCEVVVLARVLPDRVNSGYQDLMNLVVKEVNGNDVGSMIDLVFALETHQGDYYVIRTEEGDEIILDRKKVELSHGALLERYGITRDRSEDLPCCIRPSLCGEEFEVCEE